MHDGMPYGRNQGQGQGHSREVDRQSPTGLIFEFNLAGSMCQKGSELPCNGPCFLYVIISPSFRTKYWWPWKFHWNSSIMFWVILCTCESIDQKSIFRFAVGENYWAHYTMLDWSPGSIVVAWTAWTVSRCCHLAWQFTQFSDWTMVVNWSINHN